jgi:hypothetical protein
MAGLVGALFLIICRPAFVVVGAQEQAFGYPYKEAPGCG